MEQPENKVKNNFPVWTPIKLFKNDVINKVRKENFNLSECEIALIITNMWMELSENERKVYYEKAEQKNEETKKISIPTSSIPKHSSKRQVKLNLPRHAQTKNPQYSSQSQNSSPKAKINIHQTHFSNHID